MPRKADERVSKAKQLFKTGLKLKNIASQLGVPEGTVRRWKSTHKWDDERSEKESERSDKNSERSKQKTKVKKKAIAEEVNQVTENSDLTDQQRLFCIYYIRCFNATKAYKKAYSCSYETAMTNGSRMLRIAKVVNQITELKKDQMNKLFLSEQDIFNKYIDIVFADMKDYASWGQEKVPVLNQFGVVEIKNSKTGKKEPLMQDINTVRLAESTEVDGTLVTEIKQGKDGVSIKLADRMKALQWLADHMNLATEEQKAKIALMKAKAEPEDTDGDSDDGFIDALNNSAADDWKQEDDKDQE